MYASCPPFFPHRYFFVAAAQAHLKWIPHEMLQWYEEEDGSCHPIKNAAKCYLYDPRWPLEPLPIDAENVAPFLQYPYYLSLRCKTPWRVPVLHCRFPERPSDSKGDDGELTDEAKVAKGRLALTMMYLSDHSGTFTKILSCLHCNAFLGFIRT